MVPVALTIAGSDPSGGAGIQADLKTFSRLDVYGMAVIAALTAQNTVGVRSVMDVPPEFLEAQLDAVLSDISPDATKTGMLGSAEAVRVVARKIREYRVRHLVVDPVLVSTSGTPLLADSGIEALKRELLPLADVVTPNLHEAAVLTGMSLDEIVLENGMDRAAMLIHGMGARHVLVKGGHLEGDAVDIFFDGATYERLVSPRVPSSNTHGTGCVLSAAIAAFLASGLSPRDAAHRGKAFVTRAIERGLDLGRGVGPVNPL